MLLKKWKKATKKENNLNEICIKNFHYPNVYFAKYSRYVHVKICVLISLQF